MQTPAIPYETKASAGVFDGVTRYHWLVVIIASCGWLFDCMDQRLFILARESALKDLLASDPERLAVDQDAHRLRDDVDDSRLGDRRDHLRHDERPDRPREDDGRHAHRLFGLHRAFGICPDVGGLHDLSLSRRARRRRDVRRGHDARGRKRPGTFSRDGARLAAGAVRDGEHHGVAHQPADSAGRARPVGRLRRLARPLLRRHSSVAAGRADHVRAQGTAIVAEGQGDAATPASGTRTSGRRSSCSATRAGGATRSSACSSACRA